MTVAENLSFWAPLSIALFLQICPFFYKEIFSGKNNVFAKLFFPRIFQTKWNDGKILQSLTDFAKVPWRRARFGESNISKSNAKNVKFGKKTKIL